MPEPGPQAEARKLPPIVPTPDLPDQQPLDALSQVGAAARPLLQPSPYRELVVEIDWVTSHPPDSSAVDHLITVLRTSIGKPVSVRGGNELPRQSGPYYPSQIRALAERRDRSSGGSVAAIWIVYLDGSLAANRRAAGAAISGTVMAIFPDRLRESGGEGDVLEAATLVHEMGHLLGLINIGYTSPRRREDPKYPGHSINRGSVMHWSVEAASWSDDLPMTFDEDDLADLRGLANGSL
ncbi:MAG: hypothetical protein KY429_02000 [Actinobacteria bacterium]|nr:hypothetical protein [Actinomycetota bacterium]